MKSFFANRHFRQGLPRLVLAVSLSLLVLAAVLAAILTSMEARHDRDWIPEHQRLPHVVASDSGWQINGIRDFRYESGQPSEIRWLEEEYDPKEIVGLSYILSPFKDRWRGPAHSLLSFEFTGDRFLGISVEARKEVGESYSPWKGLVRSYELFYVFATEEDLLGLRVFSFGDEVLVYPVSADSGAIRALFVDLLEGARAVESQPGWYNTLSHNCTTVLLEHVNHRLDRDINWGWKIALPGYSDELAYERGLLDTELTLIEARREFRVNEAISEVGMDNPLFSRAFRERLKYSNR